MKKILTAEAATIIGTSPQFVRIAMQQGKLNIGTAVKMSSDGPITFLLSYCMSTAVKT